MERPPPPPLSVRLDGSIAQAHRSLEALAVWSKCGSLDRPGLDEALALALAEVSRIKDLPGRVSSLAPAPIRFLVADDSDDVRLIVTRMIRRAAPAAAITAVKDGQEALDALHHAGDGAGVTVISDYDMGPGMTGTELLSEVAHRHPGARRVLLTGHRREDIVFGAREPDAILPKENGFESLRRLLGDVPREEKGNELA